MLRLPSVYRMAVNSIWTKFMQLKEKHFSNVSTKERGTGAFLYFIEFIDRI